MKLYKLLRTFSSGTNSIFKIFSWICIANPVLDIFSEIAHHIAYPTVPAGIGVHDRVVAAIGIAVVGLIIGGVGDNGVGLDEASDFRVIVTGVVIIKAGFAVEFLSGEQVVYGDAEVELVVDFAVGGVLHMLNEIAAAVCDDVRSAKMV